MIRISRQLARLVVVLILFQFLAMAFIFAISASPLPDDGLIYSERHWPPVPPTFLKENNEKEYDEFSPEHHFTPLLDLSSYTVNLKSIHQGKYFIFLHYLWASSPHRVTLFCSFLI